VQISEKVRIIAEAGVNHNGSLDLAKRLVTVANEARATMVKFQTFDPHSLVTSKAGTAPYQQKGGNSNQLDMLSTLQLSDEDFAAIYSHCLSLDIQFISTAFDLRSVDILNNLGQRTWKIPSGEITNVPLIEKIGALADEVILSTGMATIPEIEQAIEWIERAGCTRNHVTVMHCNTEYPTPYCDVNLRAMQTISTALGVRVGYSDHTTGIEISVAAVALGAKVIEKHFTLDRTLPGPDHAASLEPSELVALVNAIRNTEKALGSAQKRVTASEERNRSAIRKGIYASRSISQGERFSEQNLVTKRPEHAVSADLWYKVIGRNADRDYAADDPIQW
jgi:N,N'-diacetyllegionaminate synthase